MCQYRFFLSINAEMRASQLMREALTTQISLGLLSGHHAVSTAKNSLKSELGISRCSLVSWRSNDDEQRFRSIRYRLSSKSIRTELLAMISMQCVLSVVQV